MVDELLGAHGDWLPEILKSTVSYGEIIKDYLK